MPSDEPTTFEAFGEDGVKRIIQWTFDTSTRPDGTVNPRGRLRFYVKETMEPVRRVNRGEYLLTTHNGEEVILRSKSQGQPR